MGNEPDVPSIDPPGWTAMHNCVCGNAPIRRDCGLCMDCITNGEPSNEPGTGSAEYVSIELVAVPDAMWSDLTVEDGCFDHLPKGKLGLIDLEDRFHPSTEEIERAIRKQDTDVPPPPWRLAFGGLGNWFHPSGAGVRKDGPIWRWWRADDPKGECTEEMAKPSAVEACKVALEVETPAREERADIEVTGSAADAIGKFTVGFLGGDDDVVTVRTRKQADELFGPGFAPGAFQEDSPSCKDSPEIARIRKQLEKNSPGCFEAEDVSLLLGVIDADTAELELMQRQYEGEEKSAEHSGGILSDVCDIAFEDDDRAATHSYDGIRERVSELVSRSYLVCANAWPDVMDGHGRKKLAQLPVDADKFVHQLAGDRPGWYRADGDGGWTFHCEADTEAGGG